MWSSIESNYKVLKPLGEGTFGEVFLAKNIHTSQKVAIKRMDNIFHSPYTFKKVVREIQILGQLTRMKHSETFSIQLLDVIVPDQKNFKSIFLVTSYNKSGDLRKMINEEKPEGFSFSDEHIKVIFYNLLCCVNFLHSANIVHRDLKPANILIDNQCNITICDFGLSRTLAKPDKKRSMTSHVSSRFYRAPELILCKEDYDTKVDSWSLGCILAELLSFSDSYNNQQQHLFRGSSCFPHSPCKDSVSVNEVSKHDQLLKILEVVGPQDLEYLEQGQKYYADTLQQSIRNFSSLDKKFSRSAKPFLEMLKGLLEFNPQQRLNIKQCLRNPYFDDIRVNALEKESPWSVYLGCDESNIDIELPIQQMRDVILKETKIVRSTPKS